MNSNDLNSILSNLELTAITRASEVKVAALLERLPIKRQEMRLHRMNVGTYFILINDAYPEHRRRFKMSGRTKTCKITPFLESEEVDEWSSYHKKKRKSSSPRCCCRECHVKIGVVRKPAALLLRYCQDGIQLL